MLVHYYYCEISSKHNKECFLIKPSNIVNSTFKNKEKIYDTTFIEQIKIKKQN